MAKGKKTKYAGAGFEALGGGGSSGVSPSARLNKRLDAAAKRAQELADREAGVKASRAPRAPQGPRYTVPGAAAPRKSARARERLALLQAEAAALRAGASGRTATASGRARLKTYAAQAKSYRGRAKEARTAYLATRPARRTDLDGKKLELKELQIANAYRAAKLTKDTELRTIKIAALDRKVALARASAKAASDGKTEGKKRGPSAKRVAKRLEALEAMIAGGGRRAR
jgi:hypothetical protein